MTMGVDMYPADEYHRVCRERDEAIRTRENANTVSVRVEQDNRRLTTLLANVWQAIHDASMSDADAIEEVIEVLEPEFKEAE